MFDVIIRNGMVVDGTGTPAFRADVGVKGDKIQAVGNLSEAKGVSEVDAAGCVVTPGFIDIHTHSDLTLIYDPHSNSKIHDGVTTECIGQCGVGPAPVTPKFKDVLLGYLGTRIMGSIPVKLELHWESYKEYFDYLDAHPASVNVAPMIAHGPVRIAAMGLEGGAPSTEQMALMKRLVRESMDAGGLGVTSGLVYVPGAYTTQSELAEILSVLRDFGSAPYMTHIRSESAKLWEAVDEAVATAKEADVPLHVSHLKIGEEKFHGQTAKLFGVLDKAASEGMDVSNDVYPYVSGMTSGGALLPPWVFEGGTDKMLTRLRDPAMRKKIREESPLQGYIGGARSTWVDSFYIATVVNDSSKHLEGLTFTEATKVLGTADAMETLFEILLMENGRVQVIIGIMSEDDVESIIKYPRSMIGSDGAGVSTEGILNYGKTHPRFYCSFSTILAKYVREKKSLTLEQAVHKMTQKSALRLQLDRRGQVAEGFFADLLVFDPQTVTPKSTVKDPCRYSEGFKKVFVNGTLVISDGEHQETFPGRRLQRK